MSSPGSRHIPDSTARPKAEDVSDVNAGMSGGNEAGHGSERSQTREDLEKALHESKKS
jgi:hypothetical protein